MSAFTAYLQNASLRPTLLQEADILWKLVLTQADPLVLDRLITELTEGLYALPVDTPKEAAATVIRLIAHLDEQREAAELAANPARRAGIERVGAHFARKAQSGFSNSPLPDEKPE